MSSRPLRDIRRTTSFRIAVLFLVLFGAAAAALIAFLYWQTAGYLSREVDGTLTAQVARWSQLEPAALLREVTGRTQRDTGWRQPAGLFAATGERLAGVIHSVRDIVRYDEPFDLRLVGPDGDRPVRAVARVLDSGEVLVAGQDVYAMREFDELLVRAVGGAAALVFPAGLIGAIALGFFATRRLDATTRAIERIVAGRLNERLPIRGNHDDVDRLAVVVNGMLDEIERLLREVKGVTDDVAHDLRTPLTRLLAGLEHAEAHAHALTPAQYAEVVTQTGAQARLMLRMFQALLRISDIENRVQRDELKPVSLPRIARDAFELFEPAAEEKDIAMSIAVDDEAVQVRGHADLLFNAVSNLLDNAVKFTPRGGRVEVRLTTEAGQARLAIADTGPGIPENERDAVFRRFYRSERSRQTDGNGLGLSLVQAVARRHGFGLTIGSGASGTGCVITLVAPISPA